MRVRRSRLRIQAPILSSMTTRVFQGFKRGKSRSIKRGALARTHVAKNLGTEKDGILEGLKTESKRDYGGGGSSKTWVEDRFHCRKRQHVSRVQRAACAKLVLTYSKGSSFWGIWAPRDGAAAVKGEEGFWAGFTIFFLVAEVG